MKTFIQQWLHPVFLMTFCTLLVAAVAQSAMGAQSEPRGTQTEIVR